MKTLKELKEIVLKNQVLIKSLLEFTRSGIKLINTDFLLEHVKNGG